MIRVNVHLDSSWLKRLDEIKDALIRETKETHWIGNLTRADLIRIGLAEYYGFENPYTHTWNDDVVAELAKLLKKSAKVKGV